VVAEQTSEPVDGIEEYAGALMLKQSSQRYTQEKPKVWLSAVTDRDRSSRK
jgi:hypothetical protein